MSKIALELPLSTGGIHRFQTVEQLSAWLVDVRSQWTWFLNGNESQPQCVGQGRNWARELLDDINNRINSDTANWAQTTLTATTQRFARGFPLAPTNPVLAGLMKAYTGNEPAKQRAVGAYLYAERLINNTNIDLQAIAHPVCLQAISYVGETRARLMEGLPAVAQASIERSVEEVAELVRTNQAALLNVDAQLQSKIDDVSEKLERDRVAHSEGIAEAIKRIDETRDSYEEVMRLKTPVDYWATKGTEHRATVQTYRWTLGWFSGVFLVGLGAIYFGGWELLSAAAKSAQPNVVAMTIYIAGFVGAVTAVGLWLIRIVVRLYMSQHHLAADADERASLLRTYLALTQAGKVSEQERALVLAAVFRPVPDGIVKDDGAPALTPMTLLAGALDRGAK